MTADVVLKAHTIITMDKQASRAEAVAFDSSTGVIEAIGTIEDVQAAAPSAAVTDLGDTVLMPGFVEPHSHPLLSGMATQKPAHWIAPFRGYPDYSDVEKLFRELDSSTPPDQLLLFFGLDRLLQGAPELNNADLDKFFPTRVAVVFDNSGHEAYFNTAAIATTGWTDGKPPADPVGARFGRNEDGTSNGRAYETAAILAAVGHLLSEGIPHPLQSMAQWYQYMAQNGITMTTEHTYQADMLPAYIACASVPDVPLRVALYHMSIEENCGEKISSPVPETMLWKQGIKLWADGSPWVGTIAASFPYLDTQVVQRAQIPLGPGGESMMNYTRAELDQILDKYAPLGWQFAFHVNGDVGLDIVLDAYERALADHNLLGTDHRWRVEHCGGCRGDQFDRAARLGVTISLAAFQFIYWGDLLDGQMFEPEIGSQWVRASDAFASGAVVSFHNDGSVSPPIPLLNIQAMVTRRTFSGQLHGQQQAITLEDAFKAHTINAAHQLRRDHDLGSIEVGKRADFVELSNDPFLIDPASLTDEVKVQGTWVNGHRIALDGFVAQVAAIDPTLHQDMSHKVADKPCC